MTKVVFLLLCGLPAAGKTTFAARLASCNTNPRSSSDGIQFVVLSYDEFIPTDLDVESQSCDGKSNNWKNYRLAIWNGVDNFLNTFGEQKGTLSSDRLLISAAATDNLDSGKDIAFEEVATRVTNYLKTRQTDNGSSSADHVFLIVIDDNMYYRSMRMQYLQLARKYSLGFCQAAIKVPLDDAIARNHDRVHAVNESTLIRMHSNFEWPDPDGYPWERNSIILNSSGTTFTDEDTFCTTCLIRHAIEFPEAPFDNSQQDLSRRICVENVLHQADQIVRKEISRRMQNLPVNGPANQRSTVAKQLSDIKKRFLFNLRQTHVTLSYLVHLRSYHSIQPRQHQLNITPRTVHGNNVEQSDTINQDASRDIEEYTDKRKPDSSVKCFNFDTSRVRNDGECSFVVPMFSNAILSLFDEECGVHTMANNADRRSNTNNESIIDCTSLCNLAETTRCDD